MRPYDGTSPRLPGFVSGRETPDQKLRRLRDYSERVNQLQDEERERDTAREVARFKQLEARARRVAAPVNLKIIQDVSNRLRPDEPTSRLLKYVHGSKVAEDVVTKGAAGLPENSPFHRPAINPESLKILSNAAEGFVSVERRTPASRVPGAPPTLESMEFPVEFPEALHVKSIVERTYFPEGFQGLPRQGGLAGQLIGGVFEPLDVPRQRIKRTIIDPALPDFRVDVPLEVLALGVPVLGQVALADLALKTVQKISGVDIPELSDIVPLPDVPITDELVADLLSYTVGDPLNYVGLGIGMKGLALIKAAKAGSKPAALEIARNPSLLEKMGNGLRAQLKGLGRLASQDLSGRISRSVEMSPTELLTRKTVGTRLIQSVDGVPSELLTQERLIELASTQPNPGRFFDDLIEEASLEFGPESIVRTPDGKVGIVRTPEMGTPDEAADALTDFVMGRDRRLTFEPSEAGGGRFGGFEAGKGGEAIVPPKAPREVPTERLPVTGEVSTARPKRPRVTGQADIGLPTEAKPLPEPKPAPTVESLKREFDLAVGRAPGVSNREVLDNIRAGVFHGEPIDFRVANQLLNELEGRGGFIGNRFNPRTHQLAAAIRRGYRQEISQSIENLNSLANRGPKLEQALKDFGDPRSYETYVDEYVDNALTLAARGRGPSPSVKTLQEEAGWRFMHDQGVPGFEADLADLEKGIAEIVDNILPLSLKESQSAQEALRKLLYGAKLPIAGEIKAFSTSFGPNSNEIIKAVVSAKTSLSHKVWQEVVDTLNVPRLIKSVYDHSMPLRQAVIPTIAHPFEAAKAFRKSLRAGLGEVEAKGVLSEVYETRQATRELVVERWGEEAGKIFDESFFQASLFELVPNLTTTEEAYLVRHTGIVGGLIRRVPGVGASERLAVTYLNELRAGIEQSTLRGWAASRNEVSLKAIQQLGEFISVTTGRGVVPKSAQGIATMLNPVLWSTRLFLSRIEHFTMLADPRTAFIVRRQIARDMGLSFGAIASTVALASEIPGVEVRLDPLKAEFGTIKIGDTRLDPWGGFKQYGVLAARLVSDIANGNLEGAKDHLWYFARSKFSPVPGKLADIYEGETFVGEPVPTDVLGNIRDFFTPLVANDLLEGFNNAGGGMKGIIRMVEISPAFLGVGANTYINFNDEFKRQFGHDYDSNNPADVTKVEEARKKDDPESKRLAGAKRQSDDSLRSREEIGAEEARLLTPLAERILAGDPTAIQAWRNNKSTFFEWKRGLQQGIFDDFEIDEDSEIGKAVEVYYNIDINEYLDPTDNFNVDWDAVEKAKEAQLKKIDKLAPGAAEAIKQRDKFVNPDLNAVDARVKDAGEKYDTWQDIAPYQYGVTKAQLRAVEEQVDATKLAWFQETGELYTKSEILAALYDATPEEGNWEPIYIALLRSIDVLSPMADSDEGYQFVRQNLAQSYGTTLEDNRSLSMLFWYPSIWRSLTMEQISELLVAFPDIRDLIPDDMLAE